MASSNLTKVVLLACGSFNPITNMHLRMFELARDHLEDTGQFTVVKGIISPVGDAYKKQGLIEASHRLEMARLATEDSQWITVDSWECDQSEWMETAKVVQHHHNKLLVAEDNTDDVDSVSAAKKRRVEEKPLDSSGIPRLMLLCGADVLESFGIPNLWKSEDIVEIVGRYGVVCVTRSGTDPLKFIQQCDVLWQFRTNIHIVHEWVTNDISATHVRRELRRCRSVKYLLPDDVIAYIQQHKLYSSESEERNLNEVLAPLQKSTGPSTS
uniref:Nicotinamide-nucleotide adenylyltransferase n=1 Tax=Nothobranchius kuhntae TaxID=321403 RepID=A0A1A8JFM4_NOTKU